MSETNRIAALEKELESWKAAYEVVVKADYTNKVVRERNELLSACRFFIDVHTQLAIEANFTACGCSSCHLFKAAIERAEGRAEGK